MAGFSLVVLFVPLFMSFFCKCKACVPFSISHILHTMFYIRPFFHRLVLYIVKIIMYTAQTSTNVPQLKMHHIRTYAELPTLHK